MEIPFPCPLIIGGGDRVAIRVTKQLRKPNTTFAMFEKADEQTKLMEAQ